MTFPEVLMAAAANREFVESIDRLRGTSLATRGRSLLNDLVDDATGGTFILPTSLPSRAKISAGRNRRPHTRLRLFAARV